MVNRFEQTTNSRNNLFNYFNQKITVSELKNSKDWMVRLIQSFIHVCFIETKKDREGKTLRHNISQGLER